MKLCESCQYRNNTEYEKPCVVYRDDCEYYEKEKGDMTKEEAIKELQESHDIMRSYDIDESESRLMTALDMAIKALEQEPKTGHWIEQDGFDGDTYYDCSECGESFCLIDGTPTDNLYNYCPNCGADMREVRKNEI